MVLTSVQLEGMCQFRRECGCERECECEFAVAVVCDVFVVAGWLVGKVDAAGWRCVFRVRSGKEQSAVPSGHYI